MGYEVAAYIEAYCVVPDRHLAGSPFVLTDEQLNHLLWEYRVHPDAVVNEDHPSAPFVYYGSVLVRPQKWGKGPFSAARICAQADGPVLFAGWDANGEPVGMPWPRPHIQVAAVSEDQTENIWRALKPMIDEGPLQHVIPDTGLERINLPNGGLIEPVTSAATSRLGQRITWCEQDETHSWTERNGGHKLADNQRRNTAGTGGRWGSTTNAWDPSEKSVAQVDVESALDGVFVNYPEPLAGSWGDKRERRRILRHAYRGAPWVDLDRIEADCQRLSAKNDPGQAERYFGNRVVAGASKAFDVKVYEELATAHQLTNGTLVTLGFDGSLTQDATGLVVTDVVAGWQDVVAVWERPRELHEDDDWQVPIDELNEAVEYAFDTWDVWRMYADPPHYQDDLNRWAGIYGDDRVVQWWTNRRRQMALALREFRTAMRPGVMSHSGNPDLVRHIGNAVRRPTNIRDDEDGSFLWLIGKDAAKSPRKIDLAMCAVLSWEARGDAIRAGAHKRKSTRRAVW